MKTHDARLRVRYAETDQMGVVYYANYLVWMEVGRVEYCRALGFTYRDMEKEDGIGLAVAEANCRYLSPARYDEEVVVRTGVFEASPRMIQFSYEIENSGTGKTLARGFTKHVFVGPNMRPCKLPPKYRTQFGIE
jgi:acyl-CoA thioester hydrolase